MTILLFTITVMAGSVLCGVLVTRWLKRLRREAVDHLREALGGEKVYNVEDCNFFGVSSKGFKQVRGNGVLALTEKGIHFRMLTPPRYLFVPLDAVKDISYPGSFLGKSKAKTLLRVDFINQEGREDAAAWIVPHREWWGDSILALRAEKEPPPRPTHDA